MTSAVPDPIVLRMELQVSEGKTVRVEKLKILSRQRISSGTKVVFQFEGMLFFASKRFMGILKCQKRTLVCLIFLQHRSCYIWVYGINQRPQKGASRQTRTYDVLFFSVVLVLTVGALIATGYETLPHDATSDWNSSTS